jgi:UDP-N-acetylglucosamine 2-epimerase (non-hydrolysing)
MKESKAVITDSGGIQEETTFLQIPCITLRNSTERPSTLELGTNTLIPNLDLAEIEKTLLKVLNKEYKTGSIPPLWDGNSAERVAKVLLN